MLPRSAAEQRLSDSCRHEASGGKLLAVWSTQIVCSCSGMRKSWQSSSCPLERLFSMFNATFGEDQRRAFGDYLELAEKTVSVMQNLSPVFRGHPPEIRQFDSKTGKNLRSPPMVSEGRKTLTPRV